MTVGGIAESIQQGAAGTSRSLVFRADGDFGSTLTLGQVIKGKVMRHYDGNRYGVSFAGQEKVVDSSIPLKTGEMVQGKVIRLDDRVHLQRIVDGQSSEQPVAKTVEQGFSSRLTSGQQDELSALFSRFHASISKSEHVLLGKLQTRLGSPGLVANSGLVLHKLGLPLEPALITAVHRALQQLSLDKGGMMAEVGPQLVAGAINESPDSSLIQALAPLLSALAEPAVPAPNDSGTLEANGDDYDPLFTGLQNDGGQTGENPDRQDWLIGQWLLNTQSDAAVSHRVLRIPIWFGDRLVEVSLALFSQQDKGKQNALDDDSLRYRKAVFSLQTDNLGHLEVEVTTADRHLSIVLNAERPAIAETLGSHLGELANSLKEHGWYVDEIRYQVSEQPSGVAQAVVEHFATQDSLSQLM